MYFCHSSGVVTALLRLVRETNRSGPSQLVEQGTLQKRIGGPHVGRVIFQFPPASLRGGRSGGAPLAFPTVEVGRVRWSEAARGVIKGLQRWKRRTDDEGPLSSEDGPVTIPGRFSDTVIDG